MSKKRSPSFDFCQLQRLINNVGSGDGLQSHADSRRLYIDDRLAQYGFVIHGGYQYLSSANGKDVWLNHPESSGVYAISVVACDVVEGVGQVPIGAEHLLYIGSAKDICARLASKNHWFNTFMKRLHDFDQRITVRTLLTEDYYWAEKSLIRNLRPWLNIQHNGGMYTSKTVISA